MSYVLPTVLDLMEYANDGAAQAAFVSNAVAGSVYPTQDDAHVKATSKWDTVSWPYFATDPAKSLLGDSTNNEWQSNGNTNQRFHIDLGSAKIIIKIYFENSHYYNGSNLTRGAKNFTFWGSNSATAFADLDYSHDTDWTQLTCDISQWAQHNGADASEPQYANVTNTTPYRYYCFKFADNWGNGNIIAARRIELQSAAAFNDYSEATIKQEGSYSLKGVAAITVSNGKTLTRTVSPTINLTDKTIIKFDMRASRTGSNIKIGIVSGATTTEITPVIAAADTWQTVVWDISAVANANKNAVSSIVITIVNADAANTFYIDNMFGDIIPNYLIHRGRDRMRTAGYSLG